MVMEMATSNPYKPLEKIMKRNPVLQFAKKAEQEYVPGLTDTTSPIGVSAGLGQEVSGREQQNIGHHVQVLRQNLMFNMMRFDFNQRR
jgi:hypothetical protein